MGTFHSRGDRQGRRSRAAGGPIRPVIDRESMFPEKPDYKTQALCKQVRRALAMALAGECADPVLQGLLVEDVMPAPNASRLLVRVIARSVQGQPSVIEILQRLENVHGMLRATIAESIARKRTPEITFSVLTVEVADA